MRYRNSITVVVAALAAFAVSHAAAAAQAPGPLKVFILSGQSNMEGHAAAGTLDYLGEDPKYGALLAKAKNKDGTFVLRDDVWVCYWNRTEERTGNLQPGFGAWRGDKTAMGINVGKSFGPELGFGIVMGDHLKNQVLLVKIAWGGKSIYKDFRPPSSGGEVGASYLKLVEGVKDTLKNLKTLFPAYDEAQGCELAGLLWFQGWNDLVNAQAVPEYERNLTNLIKDLRKELNVPNLPVVIGELGVGGPEAKGNMLEMRKAQAAVAANPDFKGTVSMVKTALYWDFEAEKMCNENVWKGPDKAKFYRIASERGYHYLGSGKIMFLMGHAFGEGMVELLTGAGK
jgi:alpha-galactosidase